jgi:hypothetical protein
VTKMRYTATASTIKRHAYAAATRMPNAPPLPEAVHGLGPCCRLVKRFPAAGGRCGPPDCHDGQDPRLTLKARVEERGRFRTNSFHLLASSAGSWAESVRL